MTLKAVPNHYYLDHVFLRVLWKNDNSLPTAILLLIIIYYISGNELLNNPYKVHKGLLINDPAQEKNLKWFKNFEFSFHDRSR